MFSDLLGCEASVPSIFVSDNDYNRIQEKNTQYLVKFYIDTKYVLKLTEFRLCSLDKYTWNLISEMKLSETFIHDFQRKVNWKRISMFQKLTEIFIRKFKDRVNWQWVSIQQNLSEPFIKEFSGLVHWSEICTTKNLSENFWRKWVHKLDWNSASQY